LCPSNPICNTVLRALHSSRPFLRFLFGVASLLLFALELAQAFDISSGELAGYRLAPRF